VVFKRERDIFRDLPGIPSFTFQFYSTVLCFFKRKKEKRKTHFLLYSFYYYYYYYYYCFGVGIGWLTCMRCLLPLQSPPALILHCKLKLQSHVCHRMCWVFRALHLKFQSVFVLTWVVLLVWEYVHVAFIDLFPSFSFWCGWYPFYFYSF
jgi:hypothetical protein